MHRKNILVKVLILDANYTYKGIAWQRKIKADISKTESHTPSWNIQLNDLSPKRSTKVLSILHLAKLNPTQNLPEIPIPILSLFISSYKHFSLAQGSLIMTKIFSSAWWLHCQVIFCHNSLSSRYAQIKQCIETKTSIHLLSVQPLYDNGGNISQINKWTSLSGSIFKRQIKKLPSLMTLSTVACKR